MLNGENEVRTKLARYALLTTHNLVVEYLAK